MTRVPERPKRLAYRRRWLEEAAQIADERARISREEMARWPVKSRAAATERSAAFEADLIARLIRERMGGGRT